MTELLTVLIVSTTQLVILAAFLRLNTVLDWRHRLYSEEYIWIVSHQELLKDKYDDKATPIRPFERYRRLPTTVETLCQFWKPVTAFENELKTMREYYDI